MLRNVHGQQQSTLRPIESGIRPGESLVRILLVRPAAGRRAAPEPIIHGLAALEARLDWVPVFDSRFAQAPAKKNDFLIETEGEIEQTGIKVLDLHSNGFDFGKSHLNPLQ